MSARTPIPSETGPYNHHHPYVPLLQVKAASVSSTKTPANAQADNRTIRSETNACCHSPTRARTTSTAATSSTITTPATTRVPPNAIELHPVLALRCLTATATPGPAGRRKGPSRLSHLARRCRL